MEAPTPSAGLPNTSSRSKPPDTGKDTKQRLQSFAFSGCYVRLNWPDSPNPFWSISPPTTGPFWPSNELNLAQARAVAEAVAELDRQLAGSTALHCPFCGCGTDAVFYLHSDDGDHFWLECAVCRASGPKGSLAGLALPNWNRRRSPNESGSPASTKGGGR